MKPIKLRKITDENNSLGYETIEIIDTVIEGTYTMTRAMGDKIIPYTMYNYNYIAILDGKIGIIHWADAENLDCYMYIEHPDFLKD